MGSEGLQARYEKAVTDWWGTKGKDRMPDNDLTVVELLAAYKKYTLVLFGIHQDPLA